MVVVLEDYNSDSMMAHGGMCAVGAFIAMLLE